MIRKVVVFFSVLEIVKGVLSHGRGIGTRWSLRSLSTQTILWFYNKQNTVLEGQLKRDKSNIIST